MAQMKRTKRATGHLLLWSRRTSMAMTREESSLFNSAAFAMFDDAFAICRYFVLICEFEDQA